jgi:hypothetical protein
MHIRELLSDKIRNKAWLESKGFSSAMPYARWSRDTNILVWHIKQNINFQIAEDLDDAYT